MTTSANLVPHVLLVETAEGGTLAVRFPSRSAAEAWDERNPDIETIGMAPLCTQAEARSRA